MWGSFLLPNRGRTAAGRRAPHQPRGPRGDARRYRPTLEALDERVVPSTVVVTSPLDDGSSGTLRAALGSAHPGDTITFSPRLKNETITLSQGGLAVTKDVTISGPGAGKLAISGAGSSRVFDVAGGVTATIAGLTVTGGSADMGGGIANEGNLTLLMDVVTGNTATLMGGGGVCNMGTLTVSGSIISYNSALMGGGVCNMGTMTVVRSAFIGNTAVAGMGGMDTSGMAGMGGMDMSGMAGTGGGISNMGTLTISSSAFLANHAAVSGGGIGNQSGAVLTLSRSVVLFNTAPLGGNLYNDGGTVTIVDSLT